MSMDFREDEVVCLRRELAKAKAESSIYRKTLDRIVFEGMGSREYARIVQIAQGALDEAKESSKAID